MLPQFPSTIKTIGVMNISGRPDPTALATGIERLSEMGLSPIGPAQPAGCKLRNFAGPAEVCVKQLHALLDNPAIDAIIAAKGGYGVTRLLHLIDWEKVKSRSIPIIGYSDISAFHLTAFSHGVTTDIHGPMVNSPLSRNIEEPATYKNYVYTVQSLIDTLEKRPDLLAAVALQDLIVYQHGTVTGPLVPTNLTLLASLIGTPYMPNLAGAVLAIEDVNEPQHKIDGYLTHLENAGILQQLGGLIYGQFTDGEDAEFLPEIFREFADKINGPVIGNLPFGHVFPTISLPVGVPVTLSVNSNTISLTRTAS